LFKVSSFEQKNRQPQV